MPKEKRNALGKGLDAIFLDNSEDTGDSISILRISDIEPKQDQPRQYFDENSLNELAASISRIGLIQPIVVRYIPGKDVYQIVAGERRWRASKIAGLTEVPVRIMEMEDLRAAEVALIENIQRENLNAIEEAKAYSSLISNYQLTQEEVSDRVGKARSTIANTLRLLELPDNTRSLVEKGELSPGHARTLLGLTDKSSTDEIANQIVKNRLSVRQTEQLVKAKNKNKTKNPNNDEKDDSINYLQELSKKMTSRLGYKVQIINSKKTKKLEINFSSNDELEDIIKSLCGDNIFDE